MMSHVDPEESQDSPSLLPAMRECDRADLATQLTELDAANAGFSSPASVREAEPQLSLRDLKTACAIAGEAVEIGLIWITPPALSWVVLHAVVPGAAWLTSVAVSRTKHLGESLRGVVATVRR